MRAKTVYIALGSNLGDRAAHLRSALERAKEGDIEIVRESSLYETEPIPKSDQSWFLNQVVEARTGLFPQQLLDRLLHIERELGRKRVIANGARTIDLDILLYGRAIINSPPRLVIPHPRMAERRFVLDPLAELAPDLRHPVLRKTIAELAAAPGIREQQVHRKDAARGL